MRFLTTSKLYIKNGFKNFYNFYIIFMMYYSLITITSILMFTIGNIENSDQIRYYLRILTIIIVILYVQIIFFDILYNRKNSKFLKLYKMLGARKLYLSFCVIFENMIIGLLALGLGFLVYDFTLRASNCLFYYDYLSNEAIKYTIIESLILPVLNIFAGIFYSFKGLRQ